MALSGSVREATRTVEISAAEGVLFDGNYGRPESYSQWSFIEKTDFLSRQLQMASRRACHRPSAILDSAISTTRLLCQRSDKNGNDLKREMETLCEMLNSRIAPCPSRSADKSDWLADFQEAWDMMRKVIGMTDQKTPEMASRMEQVSYLSEDAYDLSGEFAFLERAIEYLRKAASIWKLIDLEAFDKATTQISWLQLRIENPSSMICVLEMPVKNLHLTPVSLDKATSGRFRFLDCESLAKHDVYRILEFTHLPTRKYAAVSYPWRGMKSCAEPTWSKCFNVFGAAEADAISVRVLRSACLASLHLNSGLLWLDQLCILQADRSDKNWQVKNMHELYRHSKFCLVIPGGLASLAGLDEETTWIHRAWTLQESLAPSSVLCLFKWTLGDACIQHITSLFIQEVEPKTAGVASLADILLAERRPAHFVYPAAIPGLKICIFGDRSRSIALQDALHETNEARHIAVWSSAYMRTSSRPVDMILSIMGLLGLALDPARYAAHERHKATLDLIQASLDKGARASWLGIAPLLTRSPLLSIIPTMPESSVDGKAFVKIKGELKSAEHFSAWWIKGLPKGSLDNEGYFRFGGRMQSIRKVEGAIAIFETSCYPIS